MSTPHVTLVYAGERFPIGAQTGDQIVEFVSEIEAEGSAAGQLVVATTDGRQVIANLGPSIPYAIEVAIEHQTAHEESSPDESVVRTLVAEQEVASNVTN